MLYPAFLFCYNKREVSTFNRGSIIDRLEGHLTVEVLRDALIKNIETAENMNKNRLGETASLIQQQKNEIEQLERQESERKRKEKEDTLRKQSEEEEKRKKALEIEEKKKQKMRTLPEEPEKDNPNSCYIIFRYPDGSRRAERRFLKTEKLEVLYDFVDSLGADIFEESDKYDLIQPFPLKIYSEKQNTLEQEKLFPNAVLQIREI
jgi:hypothetical protein